MGETDGGKAVLVIWDLEEKRRRTGVSTNLSTSPDVTQCVTGGPESTKHLKIYGLH